MNGAHVLVAALCELWMASSTRVRNPSSRSSARSAPERDMWQTVDGRLDVVNQVVYGWTTRLTNQRRFDMFATADPAALDEVTHHTLRSTAPSSTTWLRAARHSGRPGPWVPRNLVDFRKLIPLLAPSHRVYAVDLPGFGDSDNGPAHTTARHPPRISIFSSKTSTLAPSTSRARTSAGRWSFVWPPAPDNVRSFTAIEMGLPGFGLESLADITHGGTWHIGVLAAPEIPEMLLVGPRARVPRAVRLPGHERNPGSDHRH